MSAPTSALDVALQLAYSPAITRVHELMRRVKPADLSPAEILALLAVLESADRRLNATAAPVLRLVPHVVPACDAPSERLTNETT